MMIRLMCVATVAVKKKHVVLLVVVELEMMRVLVR